MHSIAWPCCVHVASHCKLHLHCLNQNVLAKLHISAFLSAAHLILRRPFRDRCLHSSFSTVRRFAAVNAKLVQKQSKIFSMIVSHSYRCQILEIITQKLETIYLNFLLYIYICWVTWRIYISDVTFLSYNQEALLGKSSMSLASAAPILLASCQEMSGSQWQLSPCECVQSFVRLAQLLQQLLHGLLLREGSERLEPNGLRSFPAPGSVPVPSCRHWLCVLLDFCHSQPVCVILRLIWLKCYAPKPGGHLSGPATYGRLPHTICALAGQTKR